MSHTDYHGRQVNVGATVQRICDIGTNAERWYGWVESADDKFVYVSMDCWYDIYGNRQELGGNVVRVHPQNLRTLGAAH